MSSCSNNFLKISKKSLKIFKYEIESTIRTNSKRTILICKTNTWSFQIVNRAFRNLNIISFMLPVLFYKINFSTYTYHPPSFPQKRPINSHSTMHPIVLFSRLSKSNHPKCVISWTISVNSEQNSPIKTTAHNAFWSFFKRQGNMYPKVTKSRMFKMIPSKVSVDSI